MTESPISKRASDVKLTAALREAGLTELVTRAERGYYNEYFGVPALPEIVLAGELAQIGTKPALAVRERLINGEFDAGKEEGDEWADSPEGRETFAKLVKPRRR